MSNRCLINDKVNDALNAIVKQLFATNRLFDRQMSELSVKFTMNNTSNILHPLIAHYPLTVADWIGDYQDSRNALTEYGETPEDKTDYNSVLDMFEKYLEYQTELEELISEGITIAKDNGDRMTKKFLDDFLLKINPFTAQAILLCDKLEAYGDNPSGRMQFDRDIENFIVAPFIQGKTLDINGGNND